LYGIFIFRKIVVQFQIAAKSSFKMKKALPIYYWLICISAFVLFSVTCFAQVRDEGIVEKKVTNPPQFNLGADLVSRYIWRGKDFGNSPAIQPNVAFSDAGFKISAWGSFGFVPYSQKINDTTTVNMGNYAEFDPSICYTYKGLTLSITDYYFPNGMTPNNNNYFDYNNSTTGHTFEVALAYAGPEKFPIQLFAGTLVYGADKGKDAAGNYGLGTKNNFSTYFEAAYNFTVKGIGVKPFIGGIPFGSSWYGPSGGVVNTGITVSKTIPITKDFGIPVFTSIIANPQSQSVFFVFGLTL
jgi:hypothetical protein